MTPPLPDGFLRKAEELLKRYPRKQAALLPLLKLLQDERGCLGPDEEEWAAGFLDLPPVKVREVVTFYTLFRRKPVGRHHLQVCRNVSCFLSGAEDLLAHLRDKLGISEGETTKDGRFSLTTVECLGHCEEAPCLMIDDRHYGRLDAETVDDILEGLE